MWARAALVAISPLLERLIASIGLARTGPRNFLAGCGAQKSDIIAISPGTICCVTHKRLLGVQIIGAYRRAIRLNVLSVWR